MSDPSSTVGPLTSSPPRAQPDTVHTLLDLALQSKPNIDTKDLLGWLRAQGLKVRVENLSKEIDKVNRQLEDRIRRPAKSPKLSGPLALLDTEQKATRRELTRVCRYTMKGLCGLIVDELPEGQMNIMSPNLERSAGRQPNESIIMRAVKLISQKYMNKETRKLEIKEHEFTHMDVRKFVTQTFNGWKADHDREKSVTKMKMKSRNMRRNRRHERQIAARIYQKGRVLCPTHCSLQLANRRLTAKHAFEEQHGCKLSDKIFDPDFMTPYHSELDSGEVSMDDSDDNDEAQVVGRVSKRDKKIEEARQARYDKLAEKAPISLDNAPVWEIYKKAFRSAKYNSTISELDLLAAIERSKAKGKGRTRVFVPKVDLGRLDNSAPRGKRLYPFMVDPNWLALHSPAGNAYELAPENPVGF